MPTTTKGSSRAKPASPPDKGSPDIERKVEPRGPIARVGNLTRESELRFGTDSGIPFCRFGLAVETRKEPGKWSGERQTTFYEATAFGSLAEHVAELPKGTRVVVVGKGEIEHWTDADGNERTTKRILVDACGPDLRWATATVKRDQRRPQSKPAADEGAGNEDEDF